MADSPFTGESIPDLLRARVEASPDVEAYWHEADGRWLPTTWRQFSEKVDRLAAGLVSKGLTPGTHVGLLFATSIEWEVAHHAVLQAGGVVVGLEPHDTAERLHWIIGHADVAILIVQDRSLYEKIKTHGPLALRMVVFVDGSVSPEAAAEARLTDLVASEIDNTSLPPGQPNAAATIIYTSGTTGQPKGILYRHEQVVLAIHAITAAYPTIAVGSRFVCWLPLSNLFQRIMNLAAMQVGGTVYLVRNPLDVMKALPVAKPDIFIGVPRFYEKLYDGLQKEIARKPAPIRWFARSSIDLALMTSRAERANVRISAVRRHLRQVADRVVLSKLRSVMGGRIQFMITGSAPTPIRLLEFFHAIGLPLYEAYGMSENVVPIAVNRPDAFRLGSVGRPLEINQLTIADDGELRVRGRGVFDGYFKDDASGLKPQYDFHATGDYAVIDADGYLHLRGRKSEILKTATGRRISPIGIEDTLNKLTFVDRAVVVGTGRKCLAAILTLQTDSLPQFRQRTTPANEIDRSRLGPEALTHIAEEMIASMKSIPEHERPVGAIVLDRQLSIELGELTPNLKLRRATIEQRMSTELDRLYDEIDTSSRNSPVIRFVA